MSIKGNFLDKSQATYTYIDNSKCLIVSNYSAAYTKTKNKVFSCCFHGHTYPVKLGFLRPTQTLRVSAGKSSWW